ncbi:MAG: hypothetical protein IJN63_02900 [Clostridia bacterium]|nr:hypothetical protein [Clostridia bacterium]
MSINDVVNTKGRASAKNAKYSKSDITFWRMTAIFAVLAVYTVFELYAHSSGANVVVTNGIAVWGSVLFALGAIVCFVLGRVKGNNALGILNFGFASAVLVALAVFLSLTYEISDSSALIILAFACAALAFVGYSFSRDFFLLSSVSMANIVLAAAPRLFVYSEGFMRDITVYGSVVLSFVLCAAFCVLALAACNGKSEKLSNWFFNFGYVRRYPLFLLPVVCFAVSVIRLIAPAFFSYSIVLAIVLYMVFLVIYAFDSAK